MPDYLCQALLVFTGLCLLRLLADILRHPAPVWFRLAANAAAGVAALLTANALGSLAALRVGVNPVTCLVSALLGPPGAALLWGLKLLF